MRLSPTPCWLRLEVDTKSQSPSRFSQHSTQPFPISRGSSGRLPHGVGGRGARCGPAEPAEVTPRAAASRGFEGTPFEAQFSTSSSPDSTSKLVFAAADGDSRRSSTATFGPIHAALGIRVENRLRAVGLSTSRLQVSQYPRHTFSVPPALLRSRLRPPHSLT